ncbi:hypothetical protein QYS49_39785 [Marivirga salinae]|uniref:TonB C-terminal domain-containing protein n=1 Tax=Marivirga salinarum TaxID=3059078 RepID=A0AA51NAM0_9BACT|nr:hypothetical protein [Marivirga sp. BDSF4-3]WMN11857.1 hypothetical protein QYS49_39785 [Marivirga sp. BDSF4-3]
MKNRIFILLSFIFWINFFSYGQKRDSVYNYKIADIKAKPIGGQEAIYRWIIENVNTELLNRIDTLKCELFRDGKVMVSYSIDNNGILINPRIEYGLGEPYNSEALRLIKEMPIDWIPGTKNSDTITIRTATTISFCQSNDNK